MHSSELGVFGARSSRVPAKAAAGVSGISQHRRNSKEREKWGDKKTVEAVTIRILTGVRIGEFPNRVVNTLACNTRPPH